MFWSWFQEKSTFYKHNEDYILYGKVKNIASDNFRVLYIDSKAIIILSTSFQEFVPF